MTILTIQPPAIDSRIYQGLPDTNYGSLDKITVQATSGDAFHIVLNFDFSSLPGGVTINSATLELYDYLHSGDPTGQSYGAYRLTQAAWTEAGVTWNKYDGANNWSTGGGDYTVTDAAFANVPSVNNWQDWNVKNQIQYARDNTSDIAYFLIKAVSAHASATSYHPREYATASLRPKLVITHDGAPPSGDISIFRRRIEGE
jgi:hypothetical protein